MDVLPSETGWSRGIFLNLSNEGDLGPRINQNGG